MAVYVYDVMVLPCLFAVVDDRCGSHLSWHRGCAGDGIRLHVITQVWFPTMLSGKRLGEVMKGCGLAPNRERVDSLVRCQ